MSSVTIEQLQGNAAVVMRWAHQVEATDVAPAFREIHRLLMQAEQPLCIIVDLRENPFFPLLETLHGALDGVYQHSKLKCWLIVGTNATARTIDRVLKGITQRQNAYWYDTMDEAIAALITL